jgi:Single-strand binding protein family
VASPQPVHLAAARTGRPSADTKVANLRLAVQRLRRNGEDQGADFVDVVTFGRQAEVCAEYLAPPRGAECQVHAVATAALGGVVVTAATFPGGGLFSSWLRFRTSCSADPRKDIDRQKLACTALVLASDGYEPAGG